MDTTDLERIVKSEWEGLVRLAKVHNREAEIARLVKAGYPEESLQRNLRAIKYALLSGVPTEEVIKLGKHEVLSRWHRHRRHQERERQVNVRFIVPGSLRDLMLDQINRIRKTLKLGTVEGFWEWQVSVWAGMEDEELLHLAGDGKKR